jgi:homoserine kinase type II
MAVFTPVSSEALEQLLTEYPLGTLIQFEGISAGIENTNYFVDTTEGRFVLTLFEKLNAQQLPFYLRLMRHLADHGVACAKPMSTRAGALQTSCCGKPAAIASRIPGRDVKHPTAAHCRVLGRALAQAHLAVHNFAGQQPNLRGLSWWTETAPILLPLLAEPQAQLLENELAAQMAFSQTEHYQGLAQGAVHADLFRDNVLFEHDSPTDPQIGGFIDFYFAGVDRLVFDLAVTVNDWCIDQASGDSGHLDPTRVEALLDGYDEVRIRPTGERDAWPMMLRAAALRFWISRLYDWHLPREAAMLTPKDPSHFERLLRARRAGQ